MPQSNEAREAFVLAGEWANRGREDDAIVEYERALALGLTKEERQTALLGLGFSLRAVGRHEEAVKILRAAITEFPDHPALRAQLALALHSYGEGREAIVALLELVLRYAPVGAHARLLGEQKDLLQRTQNVALGVVEMARELTRVEFARMFEHPFLFGIGPTRVAVAEFTSEETIVGSRFEEVAGHVPSGPPAVIAIRKSSTHLPSAVTIGRSITNDVVLRDSLVSKVHAFFRQLGGRWEVADAGSRNGTWVGNDRLMPRGPSLPVHTGDTVTFGRSAFYFLDAGSLWDRLRAYRK